MLFHYKGYEMLGVSKTSGGITYDTMRFTTIYSQASTYEPNHLTTGREADCAGGNQTTGTLVEWQVYREQDITPVVIEIHRQVDGGRVRIYVIHLNPSNLGWIQPYGLSLVENKLIINPGCAL